MKAIEELIDFLHEKGFLINSKSPFESNKKTNALLSNTAMVNLQNQQVDFNAIMHELNIVYKIANEKKDPTSKLNDYYKEHIKKISKNKISFNKHHPLFGYKPFTDLLMVYYIENKQYEKCKNVGDTVQYRESFIS